MKPERKSDHDGRIVIAVPVFVVLAGLAVALQFWAGAYEADFGSDPDEASHFMTGLMVRDYLVDGIPQNPMSFANTYHYDHYPKIALGHYPPVFYLLEGVWLTVFPVARWSVIGFMAMLCGVLATLVYREVLKETSRPVAFVAGMLVVVMPLTQRLTTTVMSDMLLSIFCLLAVVRFGRYLRDTRWQDSLWFGLWAAAAILVKGSGFMLAFVVPIGIAISGRWELLKRASLWLGAVPVILFAGPWMIYSYKISAEGMVNMPPLEHLKQAVQLFPSWWVQKIGWAVSALMLIGLLAGAVPGRKKHPVVLCLAVLPLALIICYTVIRVGFDDRYLMPALGPAVALAAIAAYRVAGKLAGTRLQTPLAIIALFVCAAEMADVEKKQNMGWERVVDSLVEDSGDDPVSVLVVSDASGEGALVAELALVDESRPSHVVYRGSKVLASSKWLGNDYEDLFKDGEEMLDYFEQAGFPWIVIDTSIPNNKMKPYHRLVQEIAATGRFAAKWEKSADFEMDRGKAGRATAALYRFKGDVAGEETTDPQPGSR